MNSTLQQNDDCTPSLILVGGPPAAGKTTLAHRIAQAIPCPAICRDEIKEGLVFTQGGGKPVWGGPISAKTIQTFYKTVHDLLQAGVTVVAEAAYMRERSDQDLLPLISISTPRMLHCTISSELALERFIRRAKEEASKRASHPDTEVVKALGDGSLSLDDFGPLDLSIPMLTIDTTDGYDPSIEIMLDFIHNP